MTLTPPYADPYDLLAESCRERWAAQFTRLTAVEVLDRVTHYDGSTDAIIEALWDAGYRIVEAPPQ